MSINDVGSNVGIQQVTFAQASIRGATCSSGEILTRTGAIGHTVSCPRSLAHVDSRSYWDHSTSWATDTPMRLLIRISPGSAVYRSQHYCVITSKFNNINFKRERYPWCLFFYHRLTNYIQFDNFLRFTASRGASNPLYQASKYITRYSCFCEWPKKQPKREGWHVVRNSLSLPNPSVCLPIEPPRQIDQGEENLTVTASVAVLL